MVVDTAAAPVAALDAFVGIGHRVVWGTVATVDRRGRPRSRVMHPYWQRVEDVLVDDADTRRAVWDLFERAGEPVGYDPRILGVAEPLDPAITVLRMDPWRVATSGALPTTPRHTWRRPAG
jgi:hypothetical protein